MLHGNLCSAEKQGLVRESKSFKITIVTNYEITKLEKAGFNCLYRSHANCKLYFWNYSVYSCNLKIEAFKIMLKRIILITFLVAHLHHSE